MILSISIKKKTSQNMRRVEKNIQTEREKEIPAREAKELQRAS